MLNRCGRIGLALGVIVLGACGDSTAPHTVSPARLARYIDSLRVQATPLAAGYLGAAELPPALGAAPVNVHVALATGSQVWQGFAWKCQNPLACGLYDSAYAFVAYSDYSLSTVLIGYQLYLANQPRLDVSILSGDTTVIAGGSGMLSLSMTSTGPQCVAASGFQNPDQQWAGNCNLGTFEGSLAWTFPVTQAQRIFGSVEIQKQAFNGVDVK